jgi:uncharacterized protein
LPKQSPRESQPAHTVWQVKVSTQCNWRCRYCYEWDRLASTRRLTLDEWRRVLDAARVYQRIRRDRHGVESRIVVAWHGGEPLLLPADYVRDVLDLQRELIDNAGDGGVINVVQTNLSRLNDTLELMRTAGFIVSVSLDGAPGARVDAAGRATDDLAIENLQRLLEHDVACGVALVIGRHNHDRLNDIYDRLERCGVAWLRLIPLFRAPGTAPVGDLELRSDELTAALGRLFAHWTQRGARLPVHPFDRVLGAAHRSRAGEPADRRDRRDQGETRLVVHPDGALTDQAGLASPATVLGNVFTQSAEEIFRSPAYVASLDRDDALRQRHCGPCRHRLACDSRAIFEYPHAFAAGPCPIESVLMTVADEYVQAGEEFGAWSSSSSPR